MTNERRAEITRRVVLYLLMILGIYLIASQLSAADSAGSDNFSVWVEDGYDAGAVCEMAETYRARIAKRWLGKELPTGPTTVINIVWCDSGSSGLTWAIDNERRKLHMVYLRVRCDSIAISEAIQHELTHVVLATAYPWPKRLPQWIEEGIACHYSSPHSLKGNHAESYRRIRTIIGRWGESRAIQKAMEVAQDDPDDTLKNNGGYYVK